MPDTQQPPAPSRSPRGKGRSKIERERDYADIAVLMLKGRNQFEVSAWIGANRTYTLSHSQCQREMGVIIQRWKDSAFSGIDELRRVEIEKISRVEREAWDAWESSKQVNIYKSSTRRETEVGKDENGKDIVNAGSAVKTVASRTQSGDARFLDIVMRCIEKRTSLLGLDTPVKGELNIKHSVINGLPDEHLDHILREHYAGPVIDVGSGNGKAHNGSENGDGEPDPIHPAV
jgi:hypothetical protein